MLFLTSYSVQAKHLLYVVCDNHDYEDHSLPEFSAMYSYCARRMPILQQNLLPPMSIPSRQYKDLCGFRHPLWCTLGLHFSALLPSRQKTLK